MRGFSCCPSPHYGASTAITRGWHAAARELFYLMPGCTARTRLLSWVSRESETCFPVVQTTSERSCSALMGFRPPWAQQLCLWSGSVSSAQPRANWSGMVLRFVLVTDLEMLLEMRWCIVKTEKMRAGGPALQHLLAKLRAL